MGVRKFFGRVLGKGGRNKEIPEGPEGFGHPNIETAKINREGIKAGVFQRRRAKRLLKTMQKEFQSLTQADIENAILSNPKASDDEIMRVVKAKGMADAASRMSSGGGPMRLGK